MDAAAEHARDRAFDDGLFRLILQDAEAAGDVDREARLCVLDVHRILVRLGSMSGHLVNLLPPGERDEGAAFAHEMIDVGREADRTGDRPVVLLPGERAH